jgi:hypothetical protein
LHPLDCIVVGCYPPRSRFGLVWNTVSSNTSGRAQFGLGNSAAGFACWVAFFVVAAGIGSFLAKQ